MNDPVIIELAGPPRGKGRGRAFVNPATGRASVYTPETTRTYEAQLRYAAMQSMSGRLPLDGPVQVDMTAAFAIPKGYSRTKRKDALAGLVRPCVKPDADNTLKLCDAMNGVVWGDDKQIVTATIRKLYSERPGLTIRVEPLTRPPPLAETIRDMPRDTLETMIDEAAE